LAACFAGGVSIQEHHERHGEGQRIFATAYAAFLSALERTGIQLPKGQAALVLRHTFASHFMISGGNILTLQRILGHSNLTMTIRYAHLAPDHLQKAKSLNPLSTWLRSNSPSEGPLTAPANASKGNAETAVGSLLEVSVENTNKNGLAIS
jgi:hypothetical protein